MSGLKDYFEAGLAMIAAREQREEARAKLKAAARVACPAELADLEAASAAVEVAEKRYGEAIHGIAKEQFDAAHRMMHANGVDCGDAKCPLRGAGAAPGGGMN